MFQYYKLYNNVNFFIFVNIEKNRKKYRYTTAQQHLNYTL